MIRTSNCSSQGELSNRDFSISIFQVFAVVNSDYYWYNGRQFHHKRNFPKLHNNGMHEMCIICILGNKSQLTPAVSQNRPYQQTPIHG